MGQLRLLLLGKAAFVAIGGGLLHGLPKNAFVLAALAYPGRSKTEIAEYLWPDLTPAHRANNLRQLLFKVWQFEVKHGASILRGDNESIHLSPSLECDVRDFERVAMGKGSSGLEELLSLYGGMFLYGYSPDGHAMQQWLEDQRAEMQNRFVDLVLSASENMSPDRRKALLSRARKKAPNARPLWAC